MSALELYHKGGVMMVFITLLSIYVLGVVFYKAWYFKKSGVFSLGFVQQFLQLRRTGKAMEARAVLAKHKGVLSSVLLECEQLKADETLNEKTREAEVVRIGTNAVQSMERHMRGLEMASSVAPLLGLLGTVIGLIDSFSKLGSSGTRVDPSVLAGGIWEALLATAAGLAVAIIAFAAHYGFDALIERARNVLQDAVTQIMNASAAREAVDEGAVKLIAPKYVRS